MLKYDFFFLAYDRFIKLWDTESGSCVSRFTSRKVAYCVKFNPEADKQHLFVAGTSDKKIICVRYDFYTVYIRASCTRNLETDCFYSRLLSLKMGR